jgi:hypothetical protein
MERRCISLIAGYFPYGLIIIQKKRNAIPIIVVTVTIFSHPNLLILFQFIFLPGLSIEKNNIYTEYEYRHNPDCKKSGWPNYKSIYAKVIP